MLSRPASKLVWCSGRIGRSPSLSALAANANRSENENDRDDNANYATLKGKRIPKPQRRALVEVFVNQYKAMNDGKLPSPSTVRKEVGGSYYVLKNILQELELQSKMPALHQSSSGKDVVKEDRCSSKARDVSKCETSSVSGIQTDTRAVISDHIGVDDACGKHKEAERDLQSSSSSVKKSLPEKIVSQDNRSEFTKVQRGHLEEDIRNTLCTNRNKAGMDNAETSDVNTMPVNLVEKQFENRQKEALVEDNFPASGSSENTSSRMDTEKVLDSGIDGGEDDKQKIAVLEDLQEIGVSKDKTGQDEGTSKLEHSVPPSVAEKDAKKSTLWVNIKSFADGFMKIWRKS